MEELETGPIIASTIGCELVGGETSEMPDVYRPDTFERVGTLIGFVPPERSLPRHADLQVGHCLVGLSSSGPHTNGYTLIRALMAERDYAQAVTPDGESWGMGLVLILSPTQAQTALAMLAESCLIGHLEAGAGVRLA